MKVFRASFNFKEPYIMDIVAEDINEAMDLLLEELIANGNNVGYEIFNSIGVIAEPVNIKNPEEKKEDETVESATTTS